MAFAQFFMLRLDSNESVLTAREGERLISPQEYLRHR